MPQAYPLRTRYCVRCSRPDGRELPARIWLGRVILTTMPVDFKEGTTDIAVLAGFCSQNCKCAMAYDEASDSHGEFKPEYGIAIFAQHNATETVEEQQERRTADHHSFAQAKRAEADRKPEKVRIIE